MANMQSPKVMTPVNKFDYVTRLVTQHEQQVVQASIHLEQLMRKTAELEQKQNLELGMLATMRDRPILQELEGLRKDTDSAHRRVDQIREEQKKDTRTLQLGLLQAEVAGIKTQASQISQAQASIHQIIHDMVSKDVATAKAQLLEAMRAELAVVVGELKTEMAAVRQESSAAAHSVEGATLTVSSLALKVRSHITAVQSTLAQATTRLEGQQCSIEGLCSNIEASEVDNKKIKKHVVKIERQLEGLQTLGSVALATDKALGEVRREAEAASAAVREVRAAGGEAVLRGLARRVEKAEARISELAVRARADMGSLAEAVQGALQQVMSIARQAAQAAPPSYLSSLLGPYQVPMPSLAQARMQLQGWAPTTQQQQQQPAQQEAWEEKPLEQFLVAFRAGANAPKPPG